MYLSSLHLYLCGSVMHGIEQNDTPLPMQGSAMVGFCKGCLHLVGFSVCHCWLLNVGSRLEVCESLNM